MFVDVHHVQDQSRVHHQENVCEDDAADHVARIDDMDGMKLIFKKKICFAIYLTHNS